MKPRRDIRSLLRPRAVAIVGASPRPGSVGGEILRNVVRNGYKGDVYPVNPKYAEIDGMRCYASVRDLSGPVDLAVIAVRRDLAVRVVDECGNAKIPNVVMITAGFKESGPAGAKLEEELRKTADQYGINLIGPNCMGIINSSPDVSLNASFSRFFPQPGEVAFISQSGSLGETFLEFFARMGIGVSVFVNLGNRAGLTENDILAGIADDPGIRTILFYLESFSDPRGLRELVEEIGSEKRILMLKAGRTRAGAAAAASHTGALATPDAVVDAFLRQSGIIRVLSIEEVLIALRALRHPTLPHGNRVAILTNAGGAGILAADACERVGLSVPRFSDGVRRALAEFLPPEASTGNPVDMIATAGADDYSRALAVTLAEADAALVIFRPPLVLTGGVEEVAEGIIAQRREKPIVACTLSESPAAQPFRDALTRAGIPVYTMPDAGVRALAFLHRARKQGPAYQPDPFVPDRARAARAVAAAKSAGHRTLSFSQGAEVLTAYGIPVCPYAYADEAGIDEFIDQVGFPIVAKIDAPGLLHRFERGAVITGINDRDALDRAIEALTRIMQEEGLRGRVLLQPMLAGRELIFGMERDPLFGPVLMFGVGGTLVEALHDVAFGVAPVSPEQAEGMIRSIRAFPLLGPFRGQPPIAIFPLARFIHRLGRLGLDHPEIAEVDVNPFIAGESSAAVDILIKLGE